MIYSDKEKFEVLSKRFIIHFILLFGSKAESKESPESSTDIAVYADHVLSEERKINIIFELFSILKAEKLDLVDLKTAPALLQKKFFDSSNFLFLNDLFTLAVGF
ncbi:MAG TPA: nucleotidyltransferase domain-containing protein [Defluviitaleaceae bacterium]|nr:nucleotidyltransferase domain-containing protein [Defluviitaleaceae bacterium]